MAGPAEHRNAAAWLFASERLPCSANGREVQSPPIGIAWPRSTTDVPRPRRLRRAPPASSGARYGRRASKAPARAIFRDAPTKFPSPPAARRTRLFHDGDMQGSEAPTLADQPAIEMRASIDFQPVEEIARRTVLTELAAAPGSSVSNALSGSQWPPQPHRRNSHRDQARPCRRGVRSLAAGLVENPAQLAQAPAQFAPGVVGHIPEQVAQAASAHGARRQRQIGESARSFREAGSSSVTSPRAKGQRSKQRTERPVLAIRCDPRDSTPAFHASHGRHVAASPRHAHPRDFASDHRMARRSWHLAARSRNLAAQTPVAYPTSKET